MSFWSGETLLARLPNLVTNFSPSNLDCNAYKLRMGSEYFCTSDTKRTSWRPGKTKKLRPMEEFFIPPGQFAFLETKETISIPNNAMGFISVRSKMKWEGLINISGFHVHPGYKGKLIFSVYNAGPSAISLEEGMPLFLLWLASIDEQESKYVEGNSVSKSIDKDLIRGMSKGILSLETLSSEMDSIKSSMRIQSILFFTGVLFFIAVFAGVAVFVLQDKYDSEVAPKTALSSPSQTVTVNNAPEAQKLPVTAPTPRSKNGS